MCENQLFFMLVLVENPMDQDGMVEPIFDYQFRVILLGDSTVGKSSLLKYFTEGKFDEGCEPTVGVDFFARLVEIKPGLRVKLQLWDTAGQERFRYHGHYTLAICLTLIRGIVACLLCSHCAESLRVFRQRQGLQDDFRCGVTVCLAVTFVPPCLSLEPFHRFKCHLTRSELVRSNDILC